MFNFFVCDDEVNALKSVKTTIDRIIRLNDIYGKIRCVSQRPKEMLDYIENIDVRTLDYRDCNIYILDIDFAGTINGLEIARRIRIVDPIGYIIFVTGHIEYEMAVYKNFLKAFSYLIKPVRYEELENAIIQIITDFDKISYIYRKDSNRIFHIKSGYKTYYVNIDDLIAIERKDRKSIIYTSMGTYITSLSLKHYLNLFEDYEDIIRIHKAYIVNKNAIEEVNFLKLEMKLTNKMIVPIARDKKAKVKNNKKLIVA